MKTNFAFLLLFFAFTLQAQRNEQALLPMPNKIEQQAGKKPFRVTGNSAIYFAAPGLLFVANTLQEMVKEQMGIQLPISSAPDAPVKLIIDPSVKGKEHYLLEVDKKGVTITGATPVALYYGVLTLGQLLAGDAPHTGRNEIACVKVDDAPRFPFRALMLDPARNFIPVEDVKFYINQMSKFKFNVLQLHLTDDQGWRMEILNYPRLTGIGSTRNPKSGTSGPDNGFYTQQQLREIVAYAAERGVEVVPELDIPGHTVAVLAAYPELGCTHTDTMPKVMGKTVDLMLCANNPRVYDIYKDIIAEVASVFPSKRIHLGGDEAVVDKNWTKCRHCQSLMQELGYTKPSQLMNYFFGKMLAFVRENGKEPLLWCELDNIYPPANDYLFAYPKDVTLITWRNGLTPKCIELTARYGNKLIMAPGEYAYLDYPQLKGDLPEFNNWGMPVTTLETCYRFDPGYGLPVASQSHILGVMGTLWGEAIKDINRVNYMTYPRALALAEAGWTEMPHRSWDSFKTRIYPNLLMLMKNGVSVRAPFEIGER